MAANRIQLKVSSEDRKITIPIGDTFDEVGREQLITTYEEVEIQDNINIIQDFETTRYSFNNSVSGNDIYYQFEFFNQTTQSYQDSFQVVGFTDNELATDANSVVKSFFKFNFYDSPDRKQQKIMFSNIMPLNNCIKGGSVPVNSTTDALEYFTQISQGITSPSWVLYEPKVRLRPRPGLNENYYIHWYKKRDLFEGNVFYMSCQFFNAKTGKVTRMINESPPTPTYSGSVTYDFTDYFYYEVILKINPNPTAAPKFSYKVRKYNLNNYNAGQVGMGSEVGTGFPPGQQPIKFYEYINPQTP